jgi:DNA-binding MarR family transcriptional regulator
MMRAQMVLARRITTNMRPPGSPQTRSNSPEDETWPEADAAPALLRSMRRIAQAIDVRSREIARLSGLTLPQLIVLEAVRSLGEVTTQQISREAAMSPPTVVAVLDKLEAKGLVERYRSLIDRRVVHTRLTAAGSSALQTAPDLLQPEFLAALARLDPAERDRLASALQTVGDLLMAPSA